VTSIKGKIVLLTGGSRGIGPIIAKELARRGAVLALCARSEAGLDKVADEMAKAGTTIKTFQTDLLREEERRNLCSKVMDSFGRIDVLINNAGLETEGAYQEIPWQSIRDTVEVNMIAPMELAYLVLPQMIERKSGHIVNIASIAGKSGAPYAATYSGTKAGIAEWTRALRLELSGTGIKFTTIFPGYVREVGMFARFGIKPPLLVGSCSPHDVAKKIVAAIENGRRESIVNFPPLRYSFALNEVSPAIGDLLMKVSGLVDFQKRKVGK
jgi:short-subunit dehydrogenase